MTYDRRIGERVAVGAMELTWEPALEEGTDPSPADARCALLMDVSVTGAGVFAPAGPDGGRVGDMFVLGFNNARAVVEVRRVSHTDDAQLRYFGVEFVALERAFEREVYEVIGRTRGRYSGPDIGSTDSL